MSILAHLLGKKKDDTIENIRNEKRMINVRFPSMAGDTDRTMTVQELQQEYKDYLIIDPRVGEQINLKDLANLEISEVVAMPPISGG